MAALVQRPQSSPPRRRHVLNVDDNPQARYLKTRLLLQQGYQVTEAETGEQALARARETCPQVICLDLKLPDLDGMAVMRQLQSDPRTASIMVLQITATFTDVQHKILGLEEGADAFLAVPFEPREFVATVKALSRMWEANEALRESEERFRKIFEHGPLGMALVTPDYRFAQVNQALCQITGYAEEELQGKTFVEITHPDDILPDTKLAEQLMDQQVPSYSLEKRYLRKTGETIWVRLTASLIRDDQQRPLYGLAMIEDISERKAQAEKLEEQAALLSLAHATIRLLEGEILVWTKKCEDLYGWRQDEAVGQRAEVLLKTEFPSPLPDIEAELLRRGEWIGEVVHTARDGRRLHVASHWVLHRHASGRAVVMEVHTDITLLKQTMQALRVREDQLAAILQSTSAVVYLMDIESRFVLVNRSFERLFGLRATELTGRSVYDFFPAHVAEVFVANNRQVLAAGRPMEFEEVAPLADGLHIYTSVKAPVYDAQGRPIGIAGVSTDITERKGVEQKIRRLLEEAERREEVLHEKQGQLVQAAKLASLGELATGLAHELNNPLNNIALFIGIALDRVQKEMRGRALQDPLTATLRAAEQQISRAADIIRQLRAFAGTGSGPKARQAVALTVVVRGAVDFLTESIRRTGARVEVDLPADEVQMLGREAPLRQMVIHLLSNALDAVAEGTDKRVSLRGEVQPEEVLIHVEDAGVGIPPDSLPRIFDPFFSTKPVGTGTGLGLSTAYGIVKDHDGTINVQSEPGRGSVFTVRLPRYRPETRDAPGAEQREAQQP